MSRLQEQRGDLARVHHPQLLSDIHQAILSNNPLSWTSDGRLLINADGVARVVHKLRTQWTAQDILALPGGAPVIVASTYTGVVDEGPMQRHVQAIAAAIRERFLLMAQRAECSPAALLAKHMTTLDQSPLLGNADEKHQMVKQVLALKPTVIRRTLTLRRPPKGEAVMRWHTAHIEIQVPNDAISRVSEALQREAFTRWKGKEEDIVDILAEQRATKDSSLHKLMRAIDTETVGLLHRELRLHYMTYLAEQTRAEAAVLLRDLARRIRLFQTFLRNRDPQGMRPEKDFQVTFHNELCDLRVLFGQAHAYDKLPIFPLVEGHLGQSLDLSREQRDYILGLRWKLNGDVHTDQSQSSYAYHLDFLRGQTRLQLATPPKIPHAADLVHCAVLYYIAFARFGEAGFDPVSTLEDEVLNPLRRGAALPIEQGYRILEGITQRYNVTEPQLKGLATAIKEVLRQKTIREPQPYEASLEVLASIMATDRATFLEGGEPFQPVFKPNRRDYLTYIDVSETVASARSLVTLAVTLRIDDNAAYPAAATEEETYQIEHVAADLRCLPVYLYHSDKKRACVADADVQPPKDYAPTVFVPVVVEAKQRSQMHQLATEGERVAWFLYRYVMLTVLYITLDVLASCAADPDHVYVPVARRHERPTHEGDPNDAEGFMAMLGKTAAFVLNHDYAANSQGLQHGDPKGLDAPRVKNALESLLANVPKRFTFTASPAMAPAIPRVALVAVSSRVSDSTTKTPREERLITVQGDIAELQYDGARSILMRPLHSFSGTDTAGQVFSHESLIIDHIHHLYAAGHRHIIYIAKSPHTSTLRLPQGGGEEGEETGLFYLSPTLMREFLRGTSQDPLHLYPLFRDEYPAMPLQKFDEYAWLINDPQELSELVPDRSQSMVMFLNILSGKQVSRGSAFHGVASYATLLNIYQQVLDDQDVRGLLYDPALRATIARYLLLYHLGRYESAFRIGVKLDPYERIIGTRSIGAEATRNHAVPFIQCNYLGYLSHVRQLLHPITWGDAA